MKRALSVALVFTSLIAVTTSLNGAPAPSMLDRNAAAVLPVDPVVLDSALRVSGVVPEKPTLLNQCSRPSLAYSGIVRTPRAASPPTPAEIVALEAKLNILLADRLEAFLESYPDEHWRTRQVADFYRQYSAFDVGGWRVIYVNGIAGFGIEREPQTWREQPGIICDGGQCCFGVEYYPAIDVFANFSFNGTFSGPIHLKR